MSLLTGIRTEEARALTWDRVHLSQVSDKPPHLEVWRSVRRGGDTKTEKSRRTLKLTPEVVDVLKAHKACQAKDRLAAGELWQLRHSFVSLMWAHGVPLEEISRLVGHAGTTVTEKVYRQELRPVLTEGAEVMSRLFPRLGR